MKKPIVKKIMALALTAALLFGNGAGSEVMAYSTSYTNTWSNTGKGSKDITEIALTQVGYAETGSDHTKYAAWYYNKDKALPWCAIFISWCANQAGISTTVLAKNALASGYSVSNMSRNSFHAPAYAFDDTKAKVGDIIYVDTSGNGVSNHVGLVYSVDADYIYTVEGNSSSKVSKVRYRVSDGHRQNGSYVSKAHIVFYARPNYSDAGTTVSTTASTAKTTSAASSDTTAKTTSAATTNTASYKEGNYKVTASTLTIRSKSSTSGSSLGELPKGTIVKVTKISGNWGGFSYNNTTGWIYLKYTEKTEEKAAEEKEADYATGTYKLEHDMNVRSSASETARVLGILKSGTKVTVSKTSGRWGRITYEGKTAWISLKYSAIVTKTAAADTAETYKTGTYTVTAESLTVRSKATTESADLGTVKKGDTYKVTETNGRFGKITYKDKTGWISLKYAKLTETKTTAESTTTYKKGTYVVNVSSLYIRSEASPDSKSLGTAKRGDTFEVKEVSGRFGKISYNGKTAWISLKYCTKK